MVAGPAAGHAVALARRLPRLRVGLHLVLVDGTPALPPEQIPDLVEASGQLRQDMIRLAFDIAWRPSVRGQLRAEIVAQFAAFRRTGLLLDHVNSHKHFHVHPLVAAEILRLARDHGIPALRVPHEPAARMSDEAALSGGAVRVMEPWNALLRARARRAGVLTPDAVFGLRWSGAMTANRLTRLLCHLPDGLIEIYTHPARVNDFAGYAPGYRYADELAALIDRDAIAALRQYGRRPVGYSDFATSAAPLSPADSRPAETTGWHP
jgi:hopanoid biosynthesis associated protein HpnK